MITSAFVGVLLLNIISFVSYSISPNCVKVPSTVKLLVTNAVCKVVLPSTVKDSYSSFGANILETDPLPIQRFEETFTNAAFIVETITLFVIIVFAVILCVEVKL